MNSGGRVGEEYDGLHIIDILFGSVTGKTLLRIAAPVGLSCEGETLV